MATINKDKYHPWNTPREQLNTLRKGHRSMLNTTRKQRNELLQEVVILESRLRNIKLLWRHFCKLSVWKEENSKPSGPLLISRSKFYQDIKNGVYPPPIKLGRVSVWRASDIYDAIENAAKMGGKENV